MSASVQPIALGDGIFMIDVHDLGLPRRTGAFVFPNERLIIETGPASGAERLLAGLESLGLDPAEIETIIVTHIHLDHAGAVGLLLQEMPHARVVVHPRGARHLADPTKLVEGARAIYRERFDELFDPVLSVPEERLIVPSDGETLNVRGRRFTVYDTPGHARHHLSIYDHLSGGVFTGDTAGILYADLLDEGMFLVLPSTSPNQFDPEAMTASVDRLRALRPRRIFFGHFGAYDDPEAVFTDVRSWLPDMVETVRTVAIDAEAEVLERAQAALLRRFQTRLNALGVADDHPIYRMLELDAAIDAFGIVDYLQKQNAR
ncbi:MAG: MBL fold metallo-hydrolase [Hydrogenibacillus sp.]|nr:MBL fold metallo-hydrolase [Hydrogenibacillus sp.]